MPNLQQARADYDAAIAAGDGRRAEEIGAAIEAAGFRIEDAPPRTQANARPTRGTGEAVSRGAAQGVSFGFADEVQGALGVMFDTFSGEPLDNVQERYRDYRDAQRQANTQAKQDHPLAYGASEFAGGMAVPGGVGAKGAKAITQGAMRPLGAVAAAGAASGGVAGAGYSEADSAGGVAADAALGSAAGAVLAPAVSKGMEYAGRGAANVAGGLRRRLFSSPDERARTEVGRSLRDEGITSVDQARARLDELGPEGRLADVGPVLQQQGVRAAKNPGPGQVMAKDFVESRQLGQEPRVAQMARETVDPKWTDYRGFQRHIGAEAKKQADEAYTAAYLKPIQPTEELVNLSKYNDYFISAMDKAIKNVKNDVTIAPNTTALAGDGSVSTRLMDQVMRQLSVMARKAYLNKKDPELARRINKVYDRVRDEVFRQNKDLEKAMSVYRGSRELQEAAEFGRDMLRKKTRVDDLDEIAERWSESEWDAMRVGLFQGVVDKLEDVASTGNSARRLVGSTRVEKLLRKTFKDEDAYQKFMNTIDAENTMQETRNKVMGGSPTYELQAGDTRMAGLDMQGGTLRTAGNWLMHTWRKIGAEEQDLAKLTSEDWSKMADYLFGDLDNETLQKLVAPTLRMRIKDSGVLYPAAAAGGISAGNYMAEPVGEFFGG